MRPETGAMRFGDDWSGVFIRGDNALGFRLALSEVLRQRENASPIDWARLQELQETLAACSGGDIQAMKPYDEACDVIRA